MSRLVLPEGQTLKQVADRLGVAVEELQRHAGVSDAEAVLPVAKTIEVPDGFLKSRKKSEELRDAVIAPTAKKGGMNMWLALDIEQKRTRSAGGMRAHGASEDELAALAEARRAYLRFEAESNDLAVTLYGQASITPVVTVRAQAFAGQALAYAQSALLFGAAPTRARAQALSAAKAALLADPKLADAHLGMALALLIEATPADRVEARDALETATRLAPQSGHAWSELLALLQLEGDRHGLADAMPRALAAQEASPRLHDVVGGLALRAGDLGTAEARFNEALAAAPSYLRAQVGLARCASARGDVAGARRALDAALAAASREGERILLERLFDAEAVD